MQLNRQTRLETGSPTTLGLDGGSGGRGAKGWRRGRSGPSPFLSSLGVK